MASIRQSVVALGVACFALLDGAAFAQVAVSSERISFRVVDAFEKGTGVTAEFRVPASTRERLPAVLIVPSTPGFDGRSAFYAEALNQAGFVTFEADVFEGKGQSAALRDQFPHAFESLQWLAAHPRVDGARVGIMGVSSGGILALLTASEAVTERHSGGRSFAAHLGVYPHCWVQRRILAGDSGGFRAQGLGPETWRAVTGRPVHILVGGKDAYDAPDLCQKFVDELPLDVRSHVGLTVYPSATFAWDSVAGSNTYSPGARDGRGGFVDVVADREIAQSSRAFAVAYFRKHLGVE